MIQDDDFVERQIAHCLWALSAGASSAYWMFLSRGTGKSRA